MKYFIVFIYLVTPSILNALCWSEFLYEVFDIYIIFAYLITITGVILFFKFNPCGFYAVVLGLILSPLYSLIVSTWRLLEYINRGDGYYAAAWQFGYIFAIASVIYYVLPFIIASVIIRKIKRTV